MALTLLLLPDATPDDREAFTRAAAWLAHGLALVPCVPSPERPGDPERGPYPPVTDTND